MAPSPSSALVSSSPMSSSLLWPVAAILLALVMATPASAVRGGLFGASGEDSGFVCSNCHGGVQPPSVEVTGLGGTFTPGQSVTFTLVVRRGTSAGRSAGFGASTDGAGTFSAPGGGGDVRFGPGGQPLEATHSRPKSYDADGSARFTLSLNDLTPGRHRLFVAVNDANGDGRSGGDRGAVARVSFAVCVPGGPDRDGDGVGDDCDACPDIRDNQADRDEDGVGDACDLCPDDEDSDQADVDGDGLGDACDADSDDCAPGVNRCDDNATCIDRPFRDFECRCNEGFFGNGFSCSDVDECALNNVICGGNATCENGAGGHACICDDGYSGNANAGSACTDVDECAVGIGGCDPRATCVNLIGSHLCSCPEGFTGDGFSCTDVDECLRGPCIAGTTCENVEGSFTCVCPVGQVFVDGACSNAPAEGEGEGEGAEGEGEGDANDDVDSGGLCAAGGAPALLPMAALALMLRRRRRR